MYTLHREQIVNTSLDRAWDFIKDPGNLNLITPADLDFKIISAVPEHIYNGLIIEYRIRIPLIGRQRWISEIKHVREPNVFVDEQKVGPYKSWYHYHELQETAGGIRLIDTVHYETPYRVLGNIAHFFFIKNTLDRIFNHRRKKFIELLENRNG